MLDRKLFTTEAGFNRARFEAIDRGDLLLPFLRAPVRIRILMVCDGYEGDFLNVTYGQLYFSLSAVLDTLQNNPEPWVKFDVTKAHRQTDPLGAADIEGFRFTDPGFDLNAYDQIWFFGARAGENDSQRLSDAELAVVARWMDETKGGVFATGDHDDLGASLCSRIPRVRAMRRWTDAQDVPQPNGVDRHDTLLPGTDSIYRFNDESDDVPMPIEPKLFPLPGSFLQRREAPHPLLCGTNGIIRVFPDHPHEGEVIEPESLLNTFSFPGYSNKPEFPLHTDGSGEREKAHVVATARVRGRLGSEDVNKGACNAKTFGVVGAYNGHPSGVGRVAVDSTWHHWFDVNLTGRPQGSGDDPIDPVTGSSPKALGFLYSPAGQVHYERIKNYFRNVALWLSSPARQSQLFFRATWRITTLYPLVEQLHARLPIWELGGYALDAIGRRAGQCTVRTWLFDHLTRVWREPFFRFRPDPCLTCPPIDSLAAILMGGVVRELIEVTRAARDRRSGVDEVTAAAAFTKGIARGAEEFVHLLEISNKRTQALSRSLQAANAMELSPKHLLGDVKPAARASRRSRRAADVRSQRKPSRR